MTADTSVGFEVRIKSSMLSCLVGSVTICVRLESRQFLDKTTHRHGFWRQFIDTIEDNSSTLFGDSPSTHLFENNLQL